jgi:secondary thiamine-phosphate synthase enzyme
MWQQIIIPVPAKKRGCHLITNTIRSSLRQFKSVEVGLLHLFLQHTSASLVINENADPDVRTDLEMAGNLIAPQSLPYIHTCEGPDDMPAHLKTALFGHELTIPLNQGQLLLGTWQGIFLWEHRDRAGPRNIVATVNG